MPRQHELLASADTVHWGYFDAALQPVLQIDSGDEVRLTTISGGPQSLPSSGDKMTILPEHPEIHARHTDIFGPHIMTGPIYVSGAEPGDVLEVRILDIQLRQDWGYNSIRPLMGSLPEDFGETFRIIQIPIDLESREASLPWGGRLALLPFFGNMGTAPPPAYGRLTTMTPHAFGGNIDNKELVAGTTLFLPVFNAGALFSVGDGHGIQGDGEVCVSALETALSGTFQFIVRKDMALTLPRAETPTHLITMAFNVDLDDAAKDAIRQMLELIQERTGMSREDAYTLMSLASDLRVTQLVNGNKGVHAMLARTALAR